MPHYNRPEQLKNTLKSISKSTHDSFNVVIVDDGSEPELLLEDNYGLIIDILHTTKEEKVKNNWIMSLPQMNSAMIHAIKKFNPEIIILQNAEARHNGDVLIHANDNITDDNYLSYACYSLSKESTFDPELENNIEDIIRNNNKCAVDSEHDSWYNHPMHRYACYDFCAAISTKNLIKLNGYDERYCHAYCYGDDDLLMRIKRLGLQISIPTNPFILHQWHGNSFGKRIGIEDNRALYNKISNEETGYKAKHLYNDDL